MTQRAGLLLVLRELMVLVLEYTVQLCVIWFVGGPLLGRAVGLAQDFAQRGGAFVGALANTTI